MISDDDKKGLTDEAVSFSCYQFSSLANVDQIYSMSDIIRAAEPIVITWNKTPVTEEVALQGWGGRVWTLPEVVLSKGDSVTVVYNRNQWQRRAKIRFA